MKVYLAQDASKAIHGRTGHTYGLLKAGHHDVLISFAVMDQKDKELGLIRPNHRRALVKRQETRLRSMGRHK